MRIAIWRAALLAAPLALAPALAGAQDRAPTLGERAHAENVLRAQGFVQWEELEFDDGVWEVEDAVTPDGRRYDLELRPDGFIMADPEPW